MVSLLATAFAFTACSDNDEPEPLPEPSQEASVTLEVGTITDESIEFTLTPVNAVKAAWVYFEAANEREVTAEQVLGAMSADAEGAQTLVAEPLSPGTEYVIYAAVEGKNGEKVLSEPLKATTTGELIETEEFWGETAVAEFFSVNNWALTLVDAEGNEATFDLYLDSDNEGGRNYLPSSEFMVADGTAPGTLGKGSYSYLVIGGEKLSLEEGELFVDADLEEETENGGVFYHIEGQLTAGGRIFTILFDGEVDGTRNPNAPVEIVCSNAVLMDINDPQPGEFYVKLNTESWNYEIVFDFLAGADAAYLPSNTYSMDRGTLTSKTGLTGYYSAPTADALTECEIEVMFENNVYTIEANAVGDNGTKFHIVYEGKIENMPEVVVIESVYPQVDWYDTAGQVVLLDVPVEQMANYKWCASLVIGTESASMPYVNGFFSGVPTDGYYLDTNSCIVMTPTGGEEPDYAMVVPDKSFISFMSVMPDQDLNQIDFQLVATSMTDGVTKVYVGSYMGPLYGGGGVSTDPVDYPLYGVNEAKVVKHEGNLYQISFTNLNGPLTINFYADTFGAGAYHFDANGGSEKTFNGSFTRLGVEWDEEDTVFEIESGSIGVVKQGDAYMFQFDNVIARAADGSAVNLGPVNGNAYQTQFTVTIEGL